jgi:hypothetical protein
MLQLTGKDYGLAAAPTHPHPRLRLVSSRRRCMGYANGCGCERCLERELGPPRKPTLQRLGRDAPDSDFGRLMRSNRGLS